MLPLDVLTEPVWQRLTWTLLHFLWQGLTLALLLAAALRLLPAHRAVTRYAMCLIALCAMAACPLATFGVIELEAGRRAEVASRAAPRNPPLAEHPPEDLKELVIGHESVESDESAAFVQPAAVDEPVVAQEVGLHPTLRRCAGLVQPYLLAGWIAGVMVLGARLLLGQVAVQWLRRSRRPISAELVSCLRRLSSRLALRAVPRVFVSEKIREAIVMGLLRPMVLLPACWMTEMTPDVLQAVLAHELAHIRRWDLWVNLLQRLLETLLFYHPAVWWVSRRIRLEREMCCDELAVVVTGRPLVYVTALELVGRLRLAATAPQLGAAMGGTKMRLLRRVRYVLGMSPGPQTGRWWPVGILALLVPLVIALGSVGFAHRNHGEALAAAEHHAAADKGNLGAQEEPQWSKPVGGLSGRLVFTRSTITTAQCFELYVVLRNAGNSPLAAQIDYPHALQVEVRGADGRIVKSTWRRGDVFSFPKWAVLEPKAELRFKASIRAEERVPGSHLDCITDAWKLTPGTYRISAKYGSAHYVRPPGLAQPENAWAGELALPTVEVKVVEAAGAAEKTLPENREFSEHLKRSAHLAVTLELTSIHWRGLESNEQFIPLVTSVIDGLQKGQGGNPWKVRFLPLESANADLAQLDPFEKQAFAEIKAGKDEVWHQAANGEIRYVCGIRATEKACVYCHIGLGTTAIQHSDDVLKEDDILGVASLRLPVGNETTAKRERVPGSNTTGR